LSIPEPFIPPLAQEIGSLLSLSHNTVVTVPSADCPACELPVLTTGTISCDATAGTYSVSYITDGGGTDNGDGTISGSIGTAITVTATNGSCELSMAITSPVSCDDPCETPTISIGGAI
jgi:hypothetical protein